MLKSVIVVTVAVLGGGYALVMLLLFIPYLLRAFIDFYNDIIKESIKSLLH
jgi:hypothetical protein